MAMEKRTGSRVEGGGDRESAAKRVVVDEEEYVANDFEVAERFGRWCWGRRFVDLVGQLWRR